jgi:hypothetical protein
VVPAWRPRLPWLLLVALIAAAVALATNYTQTLSYGLAWSASYAASPAPVRYASYGLSSSSSWQLSLMPWYTRVYPLLWGASWSASLLPWYTASPAVTWGASWGARYVSYFSYLQQQSIAFEMDSTVSINPPSGLWRGYVGVSGHGSGNFTAPAGVTLVPVGNVALDGGKFTVSGSGRLLQQVKCYLLGIRNGGGDTVALRASFNGTDVTIGYSLPCLVGALYNVSVSGYKLANVEVNGVKVTPPITIPWMNTTEYNLYVTVADPVTIVITKVDVTPLNYGFVGVAVYGYVYDNVTKARIPNGQVALQYSGATYDVGYTKSDGSFVLYMTERLSGVGKVRVTFSHIDYQPASAEAQFEVKGGAGAGAPAVELPFSIDVTLIALAIAVIVVAVLVAKRRGVLAVSVARSEYLETA